MDVPQDPILLVDYVNERLEHSFSTLGEFCADCGFDERELCEKLETASYHYDETSNRFV